MQIDQMCNLKCYFIIFPLICFVSYLVQLLISPPDLPYVDHDLWWGNDSDKNLKDMKVVRKFTIDVREEVISDLRLRLERARVVAPYIENSANKYGTNLLLLKDLIEFWRYRYNWTERQQYLNSYPQFITNIQGLDIHFIHIKQNLQHRGKIRPLILLHGWPGSVREFYGTFSFFQNSSSSFNLELVVPSLPGYGFSQASAKPGLNLVQVAVIMKKLMTRLGHRQFYIQGGDLGGITAQILSVLYPESVLGLHTNFPLVYTIKSYLLPIFGLFWPSLVVAPKHHDRVYPFTKSGLFIFKESGYLHLQSTRPDSVGFAIEDSPVGMAAYFSEKFLIGSNFSWIDDFNLETHRNQIRYEDILDNVMYYWISGSATTAFRLYYESFSEAIFSQTFNILRCPTEVPTIIFRSKYDLFMADGVLHEIFPKLLDLTDHDTGHFPALMHTEEFTQDVLRSIELFEDYKYRAEYKSVFEAFPCL